MIDSPDEVGILDPSSGGYLQKPTSIGELVLGEDNCQIFNQARCKLASSARGTGKRAVDEYAARLRCHAN